MSALRLLLVEDSDEDAELMLRQLRRGGREFAVERVDSPAALRSALERPWDLIISDYRMPCFTGLQALAIVRERGLDVPFILVSGNVGEDLAVEAMKAGAHDYVMKDRLARLGPAVSREVAEADVRRKRREAEEALRKAYDELERRVQERTGELSRANGRLRDELVERRRLEEERHRLLVQLLRGQKLQAIGQLAAGVAHEINNPVGWILSNLGTLETYAGVLERFFGQVIDLARSAEGAPGVGLADRLERLRADADLDFVLKDLGQGLRDSKDGAVRIRDIVSDLRAFTRVDPKEPEAADLEALLENAIRLCVGELKHKVRLSRRFSPLPKVPCHVHQIEQVFINLLMNAAQAIPEQGEIAVSIDREGGEAVVRIRDTGVGIPLDLQKRLFEPFFTTKPVGKGTGLGLHVAFKIVRSHGGRIAVASRTGEGTEATVRLPLARESGQGDPRRSEAAPAPGGRPVVVLVDDDRAALRSLQRVLRREPLRLLSTGDPRKALRWVSTRDVRLVLSDQRMPAMAGTSLLAEVARRSPVTRRLLITAYGEGGDVAGARGVVEDVIAKSQDDREIVRVVRAFAGLPAEGRSG